MPFFGTFHFFIFLEDGYLQMGAQFINGEKNEIFEIAKKLNLIMAEVSDDELFQNAKYHTGSCQLSE